MKLNELTDSDLWGLVKKDDEKAFKELYQRYWYKMYALAYRKLQRKDIAEELAQELFLVLWRKRQTAKIINLNAFLSVSLKNLIIDYIRHNIQEARYLEHLQTFFPLSALTTTEEVYFNELTEALQAALSKLPEKT